MILADSQRWIFPCTAGALAATACYLLYAWMSPNGPSGGSIPGLVFGFAGTLIIIFECLLSLRKKYPASPLGRVSWWLRAHVWLGLLSFLLILFHTGLQWGEGLAALLMWLFAIITVSGIFGVLLQNWLPRRMMELVRREALYDQIPMLVWQLRLEADERMEFLTADLGMQEDEKEFVRAGGVKQYFDEAQKASAREKIQAVIDKRRATRQIDIGDAAAQAMKAHYLEEVRPFLFDPPSAYTKKLFATGDKVAAYFNHLRTIMPIPAHEVLGDVQSICEERRQLALQATMHRWLHGWLYVHVPLSMGLLVLTLVHAVMSLKY
ncbi:MAG: hypothetical protein FJW20_16150 [Acidimicrobiia bacterium]|nr:hypothetical protein [Acidimicrobiia bacterium]